MACIWAWNFAWAGILGILILMGAYLYSSSVRVEPHLHWRCSFNQSRISWWISSAISRHTVLPWVSSLAGKPHGIMLQSHLGWSYSLLAWWWEPPHLCLTLAKAVSGLRRLCDHTPFVQWFLHEQTFTVGCRGGEVCQVPTLGIHLKSGWHQGITPPLYLRCPSLGLTSLWQLSLLASSHTVD